jgi:tripeptide aminopeptidase
MPSVAFETPAGHPVVRRFESACNAMRLPVSLVKTFGGSDMNVISQFGIKGVVVANAMNRVHACDEYTTVEELVRIAELTLLLMTSEGKEFS